MGTIDYLIMKSYIIPEIAEVNKKTNKVDKDDLIIINKQYKFQSHKIIQEIELNFGSIKKSKIVKQKFF